MDLTTKKCVPCEGGAMPLVGEAIDRYRSMISGDWMIRDGKKIYREFSFADFKGSIEFVNSVATIAEGEGHHPDISIFYNKVLIELWTHAIGGLSENDFIVAAKIDTIPSL